MKEFKFHIPVEGLFTIPIVAEDVKSAIEILLEKKEQLGICPLGKLDLKIEDALVIEANPKTVS
jgi:hypothetical protein